MNTETRRLKRIYDAVEYLIDLVDPSDALYVAPLDEDEDEVTDDDLEDHIIEALEAMHAHLESGNPVPRTKP